LIKPVLDIYRLGFSGPLRKKSGGKKTGALTWVLEGLRDILNSYAIDTLKAPSTPAAPLPSRIASIMQGSTETTFYVLAVYGGAVGIRRVGHALSCALITDAAGLTAAVVIGYWFFG